MEMAVDDVGGDLPSQKWQASICCAGGCKSRERKGGGGYSLRYMTTVVGMGGVLEYLVASSVCGLATGGGLSHGIIAAWCRG